MWAPLAVLAVLATIGGLIGIGPAFKAITRSEHPGARLNIVTWLNPIIWDPATRHFRNEANAETAATKTPLAETPVAEAHPAAESEVAEAEASGPYGDVGFNLAHAIAHKIGHAATEWLFIIISLVAAGLGIFLGYLFYLKDTRLPNIWANRLRPLYEASYNKYWVDEIYGAAVTRRTMDLSRYVYQFDSKVVDGAVHGIPWVSRLVSSITGAFDRVFVDGIVNTIAGFVVRLVSPLVRATQTGLAQNYALMMVMGLLIAVVAFFYSDIIGMFANVFRVFHR